MIAETFISTVLGEASGRSSVWWREKPGAKSPIDRQKWFAYPSQLKEMVAFAESKSQHDSYIPVGVFDEDSRKPENAVWVQSIWQDTDAFDYTQYRIQPSVIVHTSPGRTHCWFVLDEPADAARAEILTRKMTYAHKDAGADVSSWSRAKLLRIPGSVNTSHGFPEDVTVEYTGAVYSLQDIANAYDDVPLTPTASAPKQAAIDSVKATVPTLAELPDFMTAQEKLPADFPLALIAQEADGNRSEMREKLILECMRAGLTDAEAASIAWNSNSGAKYHDGREDLLWYEIAKFRAIVDEEDTNGVIVEERPKATKAFTKLLTAEQRKIAKQHWDESWPGEYERYVRSGVKIYNEPYHHSAVWTILSTCVADGSYLRKGNRDVPLNMFTMVTGPTTSGKSEAKGMMTGTIHRCYDDEHNPDIGDDTSKGAISEKLHQRDGKATLFNSDEADGIIAALVDKNGWRAGELAFYTYLNDGNVPPQLRRGSVDGKWSKTIFSMHMMGTERGITDVLTRKMFETGFLARFVWYRGDEVEVSQDDLGIEEGDYNRVDSHNQLLEGWSQHFALVRSSHKAVHGTQYIKFESEEVARFFKSVTSKLEHKTFADHRDWDIIKPSLTRLNISMWKMAALLALSDNRYEISMKDAYVAFLEGETLVKNLVHMASNISGSEHSKQVDMVEKYISSRGEHGAPVHEIRRKFQDMTNSELDNLLQSLTAQARVTKTPRKSDGAMVYNVRS